MYKKWELWKASVKFDDSDKVKNRPILVIYEGKFELIAYKVTSKDKGAAVRTYTIKEWKKAGLDKPSFVIIPQPIRVDKSKIISKYGELSLIDIFKIGKELIIR